ncbi:MAG: matrixin family metalloprotease [Pirellulaceae bacterium]
MGHLLGLGHHSENDALMLPTAEVGDTATRRRLLATDVKTIYAKKPAP